MFFFRWGISGHSPNKPGWIVYVAAILIVLMVAGFLSIHRLLQSDVIYPGIRIDGLDIGGMTQEEALNHLNEYMDRVVLKKAIYLISPSGHYRIPLDDIEYGPDYHRALKLAWEYGRKGTPTQRLQTIADIRTNCLHIEPEICYNKEKTSKILDSICADIEVKPENAAIQQVDGKLMVTQHRDGLLVDRERTLIEIDSSLINRTLENVNIPMIHAIPDITTEMVDKIAYRLGSFSTLFNPDNVERSENIKTACERINNNLILPDSVFSLDAVLGERTVENGYRPAKVIVNNELVDGLGGGICQVASTLYNTVLLSGLEIIERRNHSLPPSYVDLGRDATISRGYIDFSFRNNSGYAILLQAEVVGEQARITLWGKVPEKKITVKIRTRIVDTLQPEGIEVETGESMQPGEMEIIRESVPGYLVEVYRDTYEASGRLVNSERVSVDIYQPQKKKIKVAPATIIKK